MCIFFPPQSKKIVFQTFYVDLKFYCRRKFFCVYTEINHHVVTCAPFLKAVICCHGDIWQHLKPRTKPAVTRLTECFERTKKQTEWRVKL